MLVGQSYFSEILGKESRFQRIEELLTLVDGKEVKNNYRIILQQQNIYL